MELGTLLFLLLVLACPLMMLFMHRGGHGSHASHGASHTHGADEPAGSLEELRHRRDGLDAEIAELERAGTDVETDAETDAKTPAAA